MSFTVNVSTIGVAIPDGDTVQLKDASNGNVIIGSATLAGGSATISASSLSTGSHIIFASFASDGNFVPSQSSTTTQAGFSP